MPYVHWVTSFLANGSYSIVWLSVIMHRKFIYWFSVVLREAFGLITHSLTHSLVSFTKEQPHAKIKTNNLHNLHLSDTQVSPFLYQTTLWVIGNCTCFIPTKLCAHNADFIMPGVIADRNCSIINCMGLCFLYIVCKHAIRSSTRTHFPQVTEWCCFPYHCMVWRKPCRMFGSSL